MTEPGYPRPCPELVGILAPALEPCRHFAGVCAGAARWDPVHGHVPRGFKGAFGTLNDIGLVLVVAEPGDPFHDERYNAESSPVEYIEKITEYSLHALTRRDMFTTNFRRILDDCRPRLSLYDQLRRTSTTESYLCSAPREGAQYDGRRGRRAVVLTSRRNCHCWRTGRLLPAGEKPATALWRLVSRDSSPWQRSRRQRKRTACPGGAQQDSGVRRGMQHKAQASLEGRAIPRSCGCA